MFSNTVAGIAPRSVTTFLVAQIVGGMPALIVIKTFYPKTTTDPSRAIVSQPGAPVPTVRRALHKSKFLLLPGAHPAMDALVPTANPCQRLALTTPDKGDLSKGGSSGPSFAEPIQCFICDSPNLLWSIPKATLRHRYGTGRRRLTDLPQRISATKTFSGGESMARMRSTYADRLIDPVDASATPVDLASGRRCLRAALVVAVLAVPIVCAHSAFAGTNEPSSTSAHALAGTATLQDSKALQDTKSVQDPEVAQKSGIAPSLTTFGTDPHQVVMAYIANNATDDIMITTTRNGVQWSTPINTGQSSSESPAIEFWGDESELLMAYVANNGSRDLFVTTSTIDGVTWSPSEYTGQQSSTAPANWPGVIVFVANNGSNNLLAITSSNGTTWSASADVGQQAKAAPAVTVNFNGQYVVVYVANNSSDDLIETTSYNGATWTGGSLVGQQSPVAPAIAPEGNVNSLLLSFVANNGSDDLLVTTSTNGGETWSASSPVTGESSSNGPSLAPLYNNKLYLKKWILTYVANNGSNDLLATTSPNGATWSTSKKV
ncbi:MAG: sialidase family protein [Acidimicrobiales bacterium]